MDREIAKTTLLIIPLFILITGGCSQNKNMERTKTVEKLELEKFLGTWYEIARYDHSFEKGLQGVTATYSLREDGKIKVLNQGYKDSLDGPMKQAIGKAKIPNPREPGKLKVSFFWIFYGDYFVLELDDIHYQWAVIGSSSEKYLWILSRTPQLEESLQVDLLEKIQKRSYQLEKLIWVDQGTVISE